MTIPVQLHWPTLVEAVLLPWALGYALALSQWFFSRGQRLKPHREQARQDLIASLLGAEDAAVVQALTRLPGQERFEVLVPLAISLGGEERARLAQIAEHLGLMTRARSLVTSRRWAERLVGARTLTVLAGTDGPMEALLDDPEPLVVAEAAAWVAQNPTPERVGKLVALLRQPQRIGAFALKDALQRLGRAPEAALLETVEGLPTPQLLEVLHLACVNGYPSFSTPARGWLKSEHPAVRARACDLLGELGGQGISELLLESLDDPESSVRARAAVALGKLRFVPAGQRLARLAAEEEQWEGRWAAGLGLRLMGAEGMLYLHRLTPPGLGRLLTQAPDSLVARWARA